MSDTAGLIFSSTVLAAFITAAGSMFLWWTRRRQGDEDRRREAELLYLERQIEELYGPLLGLQRQRQKAYDVVIKNKLVPTTPEGHPDIHKFNDEANKIWNFIANRYLIPTQREMIRLIYGKNQLITADKMPVSYDRFVRNATQFEILYGLAEEAEVHSGRIPPEKWPSEFEIEVDQALRDLKNKYSDLLNQRRKGAKVSQQGERE